MAVVRVAAETGLLQAKSGSANRYTYCMLIHCMLISMFLHRNVVFSQILQCDCDFLSFFCCSQSGVIIAPSPAQKPWATSQSMPWHTLSPHHHPMDPWLSTVPFPLLDNRWRTISIAPTLRCHHPCSMTQR